MRLLNITIKRKWAGHIKCQFQIFQLKFLMKASEIQVVSWYSGK